MIAKPMISEAEALQTTLQANSIVEVFEATARRRGDAVAMTWKRDGKWQQATWATFARRARDLSDGLASLGVKRGDRVAVIGETQLEWQLADLGIMGAAAITVTIYQSCTPEECRYILDHSGARFIFCDTAQQVAKIRQVREKLPALEGIVRAQGAAADGFERTLEDLEAAGRAWRKDHPKAHEERVAALHPEDPASFLYTSGTTGPPKGVVLTHGNWAYCAAVSVQLDLVRPDDVALMFLPMAHSFAKVIQSGWLAVG
ncbi:MAG TPA: AMP-binding protein, partial [Anaeromyxobacter sp.]